MVPSFVECVLTSLPIGEHDVGSMTAVCWVCGPTCTSVVSHHFNNSRYLTRQQGHRLNSKLGRTVPQAACLLLPTERSKFEPASSNVGFMAN
jgi:hypothetical protein